MWFEIAIVSIIFAVGNILFGHFQEKTPKWRRLLKYILFTLFSLLLSYYAGRECFYVFIGLGLVFFLVVHCWILPRKGINGWTAEPREKYYKLRGWTKTDQ